MSTSESSQKSDNRSDGQSSSNTKGTEDHRSRVIPRVSHLEYIFSPTGEVFQLSSDPSYKDINIIDGPYLNEELINKLKVPGHARKARAKPGLLSCIQGLHVATATNDIDKVRDELQVRKVSPNTRDHKDRTPLHLAACRGFTEIAKLLIEHGADANVKDCSGNTPLHLAAEMSNFEMVTLLLKSGASVLAVDSKKHNPIHLAQTKLRVLQNVCNGNLFKMKEEVYGVTNMLLAYLEAQNRHRKHVGELNDICSRMSLLSTSSNQVKDDVKDILCKIGSMNIES